MLRKLLFVDSLSDIVRAKNTQLEDIVVDLECLNKRERQFGTAFKTSKLDFDFLKNARKMWDRNVLCRINPENPDSYSEIIKTVEAGVNGIIFPMVKSNNELEKIYKRCNRKLKIYILCETRESLNLSPELLNVADCIYVGLNDLNLSYGNTHNPLKILKTDLISNFRKKIIGPEFGFGGVTKIGCGFPIPTTMLLQELSRLDSKLCFLRRSFYRDTVDSNWTDVIHDIDEYYHKISDRSYEQIVKHRNKLIDCLEKLN